MPADDDNTVRFQSTLPARGATLSIAVVVPVPLISIHAPRTGSDLDSLPEGVQESISIHAPRTGSDSASAAALPYALKFQSTLPARGATMSEALHLSMPSNFNPRSPHGERQQLKLMDEIRKKFQSTLPARGAT